MTRPLTISATLAFSLIATAQCTAPPCGLFQLTWNGNAPVGFINSGTFILSSEYFATNPLTDPSAIDLGTAPDATAGYSASVSGAPEPATGQGVGRRHHGLRPLMNEPELLNTYALRRRVLLTAVVCFVLFFAVAYAIVWLDVHEAWLVLSMGLLYLLVARPMLRPVREAISLRRRLAYDAYLDQRGQDGP